MGKAKERLIQIRVLERQIKRLGEEIQALKTDMDKLKAIDYAREKVQADSAASAAFESSVEKIADLEQSALYRIADLAVLRSLITEEIELIPDDRKHNQERDVLYLRYVRGKTWKEISDSLYVSERHARRIHGRALASYEKVLEKERGEG